jgi:hypothetical protein
LLLIAMAHLSAGCGNAAPNSRPQSTALFPAESAADNSREERALGVATDDAIASAQPDDWFENVTGESGISFTYRNGDDARRHYILESLGGGVALFDYDNDGDIDVFCTGGGEISRSNPVTIRGRPPALYRNDGGWQFVDVTEEAGLAREINYSHGCAVADFDRDGWLDVFVCCYGESRLFRNTGQRGFVDVTRSAGLDFRGWSTSAAWPDIDADGWPDLYITRYLEWSPERDEPCYNSRGEQDVCSPNVYSGEADKLFRNRGDGRFEEITQRAGLSPAGKGLGVVAADLDGDGQIDVYVARDEVDKDLLHGGSEMPFAEIAHAAGVATNEFGVPEGSMGVDVGDYDGDGRPDIWVTNFENEDNALYRNLGDGGFAYATVSAGLAGQSRRYVGFGTALADFDGDGWLDIFVANGHVFVHGRLSSYRQPAQLFRNVLREGGGRRFDKISSQGGAYFRELHVGRGAAVGDLDDDGALDLVISHQNEPVSVLRNRCRPGHFLSVRLVGVRCHPQAVGARVSIVDGGRSLVRYVTSGAGYFSSFDQRILVAVASFPTVDVGVRWPGGTCETFHALAVDQTHELVEGSGSSCGPE